MCDILSPDYPVRTHLTINLLVSYIPSSLFTKQITMCNNYVFCHH